MDILSEYNLNSELINQVDLNKVSKEKLISEIFKLKRLCINLDEVIENSLDGIFITDGIGKVLRVNKSYEAISGLKREEIIGQNIKEFEEHKYISQSCTLLVIENKSPVTIEQLLHTTNKKALVTCNPIFNEFNEIQIIVSNVRDMSEIEHLKAKIAQNQEIVKKYKEEIDVIKTQLYIKPDVIAEDINMLKVIQGAQRVAKVDSTVLLLGETGVGKEEVAKYIHENSARSQRHFIKVNCGAIPDNLFESELFGYEKGAFTNARNEGKMGLFEVANQGTIFLDEIAELSMKMQSKLLRVLQEKEIMRVGSTRPIKINSRIIAATNKDLTEMVKKGTFREDLYYRLNVVPITIPALEQRKEDIIPLAEKFLNDNNIRYGFKKFFSYSTKNQLITYHWPGNVRELKNLVERAVVMSSSNEIIPSDFPFYNVLPSERINFTSNFINLKEEVEKLEWRYISKAYNEFGSIRNAAASLGIAHSTFAHKLRYYTAQKDKMTE